MNNVNSGAPSYIGKPTQFPGCFTSDDLTKARRCRCDYSYQNPVQGSEHSASLAFIVNEYHQPGLWKQSASLLNVRALFLESLSVTVSLAENI